MADTIPKHNQNTVDLCNRLNDARIGADNGIKAAANGKRFSANQTNHYLAEAYKKLVCLLFETYGAEKTAEMIPGVVSNLSMTISASGVALNANHLYPLSFIKTGSKNVYTERSITAVTQDKDTILNNVFYIFSNKIYVLERASGTLTLLSTGAAILYYFKAERIHETTGSLVAPNTQANGADITTDSKWYPFCVAYAGYLACTEAGGVYLGKAKDFQGEAILSLPSEMKGKLFA